MRINFKQKILTLVSIFGILLVLVLSFFSIRWHSEQMVVQTIHQTQQIIEQLGSNIDTYINELFRLTLSPYYNDEVMNALESSYQNAEQNLDKKRKIERFLSSVMIFPRDEILRVYILTEKERYSYIRTPYDMEYYWKYKDTDWYQTALQYSSPVFIPIHAEKVYGNKKTSIVSIVRRLCSKEDNNNILGVIKVDADYSFIKSLGDKVSFAYHGGLFMVNDSGDILYQKSDISNFNLTKNLSQILESDTYYTDSNGKRYICNTIFLKDSGIRIVALNSYEDIIAATLKNVAKAIIWVLLSFSIALFLLLLLLRKFFTPLSDIVSAMKQIQSGNLSVQVHVAQQDELGYLANSFNVMTSHLEEILKKNADLLTEVYETNYLHKASQYEALCNQIKPHFIHNTLNTISLLIKCGEYQKSVHCIEDLSFFLRGVMQADKEIPLDTELQLVESYLSICKVRYGDRLDSTLAVPNSHRSVLIPALTLQPIVENTIKHSCEKSSNPIHISISSFTDEEQFLHIKIQDNGLGIADDVLLSLLNQLDHNSGNDPLQSNGIGLVNVHRRLQLKYGLDSGLRLTSSPVGTTVEIIYSSK